MYIYELRDSSVTETRGSYNVFQIIWKFEPLRNTCPRKFDRHLDLVYFTILIVYRPLPSEQNSEVNKVSFLVTITFSNRHKHNLVNIFYIESVYVFYSYFYSNWEFPFFFSKLVIQTTWRNYFYKIALVKYQRNGTY